MANIKEIIYAEMENVLKQLLSCKGIPIPDTSTWHKDLLNLAVEHEQRLWPLF